MSGKVAGPETIGQPVPVSPGADQHTFARSGGPIKGPVGATEQGGCQDDAEAAE
jgi:hypothetical protein